MESRADLDLEESSINAIGLRGEVSSRKIQNRRGTSGKQIKNRRASAMSGSSHQRGNSEKHKVESIAIDYKEKRMKRAMRKSGTLETVGSQPLDELSSNENSVKMISMVPEVPILRNLKHENSHA